ncbi:MAG: AGE family epimerase/isomerase [Calditrichaceae bacterium]|nr:AGE family epimerase/isomerase [Calditrichaceae bacterium]
MMQLKPAQLEIFKSEDDIQKLTVAYKTLQKSASGIDAHVEISLDKKVVFRIMDHWSLKDNVVSVSRVVDVKGNAQGGFNSSVVLSVDPMISWVDVNCLAPGALYGDPTYNGEYSPGGTRNHTARQILLREDMLPAPLFALAFDNGSSVAVMDPSPNGASTVEETKLVKNIMIDKRFQFGAMGAWQEEEGPLEFGFQFPGSMSVYPFGPDASPEPRWFKRYHPITGGVVHKYKIDFRFGSNEFFRDMTRNAWRWAFDELNPSVKLIDVEQMRRVLTDHMAAQAATIDGRTGIPFAVATFDTSAPQWNWTMVVMGFVSKNLECADQMLRESDRDKTERGKKMREIGLSIISSMIQALSAVPLQASGYDLATGKPWTGDRQEWLAPFLRNATEGMRVLIRAYQRERELGRLHPEWFNWVKSYVDWLLQQQREDGSFPRRWKPGSNEVEEKTGTASYCPVPLLVLMTEETGDSKYKKAAIRAAEYVWENWGTRGFYVGGASDNPNITDKEAGMLSLEAFLSLYEVTGESKWLERAKAAADYTETWMWIWNLPMPVDADNAKLHWKKGVPTIGLQGITARGVGGVDEYMDWSAPSYAKLYKYTKDSHYLDVARILLHATKSMVALPGRQYGLRDIGFQQEHWRMGPGRSGRGIGGHRFWLPWVSANHLYSITGLEEFDPHLYRQLSEGE